MKQSLCWINEDRPEYKVFTRGVEHVSDTELISVIIGEKNQLETSRKLNATNNLCDLSKMTYQELRNMGITHTKAIILLSTFELGRRRSKSELPNMIRISSSKDVFNIFHPLLSDLPHEEFWILLLNRSNKIMKKIKISQGGISGTVIDTRLILKYAIELLTSGIILCHNHPSANTQPSDADKKITEKIKSAANFMEMNILDHVIIAGNDFYSFADEGII